MPTQPPIQQTRQNPNKHVDFIFSAGFSAGILGAFFVIFAYLRCQVCGIDRIRAY